ncbi:MAG: helix-turn-helix transcriptional regulator [Clostridia bacterium]|nr:helix-turn-helix transcriptional regulator [Clostridia bacterium]
MWRIAQRAFAYALSVSPQAVSKWERNISYPDITLLPHIARYFGVRIDTLFDFLE